MSWARQHKLSAAAVLSPHSPLAAYWHTAILLLVLASLPMTPVDIAFSISAHSTLYAACQVCDRAIVCASQA